MTVQDQPSLDLHTLIDRVKAILLSPAEAWGRIETEPATIRGLYLGYIVVLAAIGPVCHAVGGLVFGYSLWLVTYHPSVSGALFQAALHYLLSLGLVYLLALVIDALAPGFGGQKNRIQAFKLATYSMTAAWVAGVFGLLPGLSFLGLLGLYGIYLLYLGLPRLMRVPQDKAAAYTLVTVIAALVLWVVAAAVVSEVAGVSRIAAVGSGAGSVATNGKDGGSIEINGERIDLDKLQNAANQIGKIAKRFQQGDNGAAPAATPIPLDRLKALLPDRLPGGYTRTENSSSGAFGTLAEAEATYAKDGKSIKLSLTDLAAAGAFAQLAAAFGIESDRETANGFEKVGKVDGVMTMQQWDRAAHSGKYGVLLGNRFILDAEGTANSFDDLKAAVAAVGPDRVSGLSAQ